MKKVTENLRKAAEKLLNDKEVDFIIGYAQGSDAVRTHAHFATTAEEAQQLIWSPFCAVGLPIYLLDYREHEGGKIGVVVKGCDSRAINRLVQDLQVKRDQIVVLGIPCDGQVDANKVAAKYDVSGQLTDYEVNGDSVTLKTTKGDITFKKSEFVLDKCKTCEQHNPVVADQMLGEAINTCPAGEDYAEVKEIEAMSPAEKAAYWAKQFEKCIRCYACRQACPGCSCKSCVFDQAEPQWIGKYVNVSENELFHIVRAYHLAGRCVDCGECDRVCPMDIPIRKLNKKFMKDCKELFGIATPGSSEEVELPLGAYRLNDPEEFM